MLLWRGKQWGLPSSTNINLTVSSLATRRRIIPLNIGLISIFFFFFGLMVTDLLNITNLPHSHEGYEKKNKKLPGKAISVKVIKMKTARIWHLKEKEKGGYHKLNHLHLKRKGIKRRGIQVIWYPSHHCKSAGHFNKGHLNSETSFSG